VTLDKAQAWIDEHADVKFAVFVRIGELRDLAMRDRYGSTFIGKEDPEPSASDTYDTALAYLDRCMGAVIKHLRDYETRKNTCIVVTAPFGYDFGGGRAILGLSEACLRVPLVMYVPGMKKVQRQDLVALEDVAPTLAAMANVAFPTVVDGSAILEGAVSKAPVSMYGDPMALTIRSEKWRLLWDAGITLPALEMSSGRGAVRLYNLSRVGKEGYRDVSSRYPDIIQQWQERLGRYVRDSVTAPLASASSTGG
jgi:hypothetical protein